MIDSNDQQKFEQDQEGEYLEGVEHDNQMTELSLRMVAEFDKVFGEHRE